MTREQHSADWSSFIEGERGSWTVTFKGVRVPGSFKIREAARRCIREMKQTSPH